MPVTAAVAAVWVSIATAVMSAYAQYNQAQNAKRQALFQKQQQEELARDARDKAEADSMKAAFKAAKFTSQQRALIGSSGFMMSEGSPVDLIEESTAYGAMDRSTLTANALRSAWGHNAAAEQYGLRASSANQSGNIAAFATLATGAGEAWANWEV